MSVSNAVRREMEAVAKEARTLLDRLPRRGKLDLSARQGWQSILDLTVSETAGERMSDETLANLRRLAVRWMRLHRRLVFEAGTRPVSNS